MTHYGARQIGRAALGGALLAFLTLLFINDPASTRWFPACPIHQVSGLHCPGCGSLRAAHRLLHADIAGAMSMNPLMVVMLPVLALLICHRTLKYKRWVPWTALAVLMVYGIARNIPAWPCTLLAPG